VNAVDDGIEVFRCVKHPQRETYLRCGKCNDPICPRCMVTTPVGARCGACAQIRKLPQYDVGFRLVAASALGGLVVSAAGWYVLSFIPLFRFFAAVFLGIAVGDVVSRLARRRSNTVLIAVAIVDIVAGWIVAEGIASGGDAGWILSGSGSSGLYVALPLLLASYFAYTRLK
jgi:hypothetical protein